ncbi:MAG: SGNH/GDSL hydrolase family protein [Clostridia bacterium]|nr:SGNH/GDSL hydrolase family protein [Clostridia bacterium]
MKIVFFGDSITDMGRARDVDGQAFGYGVGYVNSIASTLKYENPEKYEIINRGIGGNRIVDLYARIKADVWNFNPDILSVLIGVNDVWHEQWGNGVDLERFEKIYRMLIEDTKQRFPNIKFILCEPFILKGSATEEIFEELCEVKKYALVVKKLAKEYGTGFVALQEKFDEAAEKHGSAFYLYDGVHPDIAGGKLIAEEWLKTFKFLE